MGITPRSRPGFIRKEGRQFDDAARNAFEHGFFQERPTVAEFLDVLRADFDKTVPRLRIDDEMALLERDAQLELQSTLSDACVDLTRLKNPEAIERLREIAKAV